KHPDRINGRARKDYMAVTLQPDCTATPGLLNDLSRELFLPDPRLARDQDCLASGFLLRAVPTANQTFDRFRAANKMWRAAASSMVCPPDPDARFGDLVDRNVATDALEPPGSERFVVEHSGNHFEGFAADNDRI